MDKQRIVDFVAASIALTLSVPAILFAGAAVYLTMKRPIVFKQQRCGLHAVPFVIYKFRSMTDDRDRNGELLPSNVRLTSLGKVLRKFSIDEIPQFWNVLRGDMRLVGPRPLPREEIACYPEYAAQFAERCKVKPGLTGAAQIEEKRNSQATIETRLAMDLEYIKTHNLRRDIKIVCSTVGIIVSGRGERQICTRKPTRTHLQKDRQFNLTG